MIIKINVKDETKGTGDFPINEYVLAFRSLQTPSLCINIKQITYVHAKL